MSRIGKLPITIPAGVTVEISPENAVVVKGKNGELQAEFSREMTITQDGDQLTVTRPSDQKYLRALHGLTRALLANMVTGVSEGFNKTLEIVGVGYRVQLQGKKLVLGLGFSHPVEVEQPQGITFEVPNPNTIVIKGIDKQKVGQIAADIRAIRPPEPYKGKGIRYQGEQVRRKVGKTGM
ncbi:MAG: 50S ribosomal protein L6 [Clostridia bacterium]|nr:50S ribosomal protein L6 [Clostridia bacterium]